MSDQDNIIDERRLDAALAGLKTDIEPERDLWPEIEAKLERPNEGFWQWRFAASVIAATALIGLLIIQPTEKGEGGGQVAEISEVPDAEPDLFRFVEQDAEFLQAHTQSLETLAEQLGDLDPGTREVVLANLKIIRASIADINEAIEREPNNVQLRQLLRMAYKQELGIVSTLRRSAANIERTTT